jgi:hypothetical protein
MAKPDKPESAPAPAKAPGAKPAGGRKPSGRGGKGGRGREGGAAPAAARARGDPAAVARALSVAIVPALMQERGYRNPHQAPRLVKIVLNMGLGEAEGEREGAGRRRRRHVASPARRP